MHIIGETHIPFLSYRKLFVAISSIVVGLGLLWLAAGLLNPAITGLRFGIDFTGGTQVLAKFRDAPDLDRLRTALSPVSPDAPVIQRFDEAEKHQVLIRVQVPAGEQADLTRPILERLTAEFNADVGRRFDLNTQGSQTLTLLLADADPDGVAATGADPNGHYAPMAEAVLEYRKQHGIFNSLDELDAVRRAEPGRAVRDPRARHGRAPSRCSGSRASARRWAPTSRRRPRSRSRCRCSACWSTSGSASSCPTASGRWSPSSTTWSPP